MIKVLGTNVPSSVFQFFENIGVTEINFVLYEDFSVFIKKIRMGVMLLLIPDIPDDV